VAEPQLDPALPLAKAGKMPAATQDFTASRNSGSPTGPPQELLTTWARSSGLGFCPDRSVGAASHSNELISASTVQQPLAAIQRAWGATPIWLGPGLPSSPTMVPMVWVPWPTSSQGEVPQTLRASNQL
jgi:hypothetical protein